MTMICATALGLALFLSSPAAEAGLYEKARTETLAGLTAHEEGRFAEAATHFESALVYRPNHPGLVFTLAQVRASQGNAGEALAWLNHYAAMGFTADLDAIEEFTKLKSQPGFADVNKLLMQNARPIGNPVTTIKSNDHLLLTESLAHDPSKNRWFLGSIYEGRVVTLSETGEIRTFADKSDGLWSAMGMCVDEARGLLWVASAATPQTKDIAEETRGKSGVFALDLGTGEVRKSWVLEGEHWFGDLTLLEDGTLIVSDSLGSTLYQIKNLQGLLEPFVQHDDFISPQGLVPSKDGKHLFLADYSMGLYRIDLQTKHILRLTPSVDFAPYGIDGLYGFENDLIAIQNGTRPQRIIRIPLNEEGDEVLSYETLAAGHPDFMEPTLGQVIDSKFHFIANSGWPLFNTMPADEDDVKDKLSPPIIMHVDLE